MLIVGITSCDDSGIHSPVVQCATATVAASGSCCLARTVQRQPRFRDRAYDAISRGRNILLQSTCLPCSVEPQLQRPHEQPAEKYFLQHQND